MSDTAVALIGFAIILGACWDILELKIPNRLNTALFVLSMLTVYAVMGSMEAVHAFGFAAFMLGVGFVLFAFNLWGGGDAKMLAAIAPLYGFTPEALEFFLLTTLLGGALSLGFLKLRAMPLPTGWDQHASIARLHNRGNGIPYGVAIAAAALITLPETEIFKAITALPFLGL